MFTVLVLQGEKRGFKIVWSAKPAVPVGLKNARVDEQKGVAFAQYMKSMVPSDSLKNNTSFTGLALPTSAKIDHNLCDKDLKDVVWTFEECSEFELYHL